ncbi:TPA: helix-turn-helix transcriptional regulator [Escherichia coli]
MPAIGRIGYPQALISESRFPHLVSGFFVGGNMKPKLLRVDQVLELLNISRGKLYRLLKNEPLFPRPIKLGGMLYFVPEEIDEFISLHRRETGNE